MKKSKHYRKDVILARVIAAIVMLLLIVLLCVGISLLIKPSGSDKNSEGSQNTKPSVSNSQTSDSEGEDVQVPSTEEQGTEDDSSEEDDTTNDVADGEGKRYVKTTGQLRFRAEPNTKCETLAYLDEGEMLELIEKVSTHWYKVIYKGQEGYVNAAYVEVIEE